MQRTYFIVIQNAKLGYIQGKRNDIEMLHEIFL